MDNKERSVLEARINDAIEICEKRSIPKFVGFLDSAGCSIAVKVAESRKCRYLLYGGYPTAERLFFGVFPDWCECLEESFPVVRLRIHNKSSRSLEHRDILGALMSAGIERSSVGDIVIGDGDPVVLVSETVAAHVKAHIVKIASSGVEIVEDNTCDISREERFAAMSGTVASLRLDCVVAEFANCGRNKASEYIECGFVSVNSLEVLKVTAVVKAGDTVVIRRVGKFLVDGTDRITKKGRIGIDYRKYI